MLPPENLPQGMLLEKRRIVEFPLIPEKDIDRVMRRQSEKPECQGGRNQAGKDRWTFQQGAPGAAGPWRWNCHVNG
jgi:hypothetical protein